MVDYSEDANEQPQPFNANKLEPAKKRKRSRSPLVSVSTTTKPSKQTDLQTNNELKRSTSPPYRKQKRPGKRARIGDAEREQIRQRRLEREKELEAAAAAANATKGIHDAVKQHYNAVPERGRDWRKTSSRIKGLRSFNNWVKSVIIQKFSPNEDFKPSVKYNDDAFSEKSSTNTGISVLDIGCGKGGDLGKWQLAPQPVELYVGIDPADISITQAKERFRQMASRDRGSRSGRGIHGKLHQRLFYGEFYVQDCFGESIEKIPIIRKVGFDGSGRPSSFGGGGFDVVSMMFCMHYAFENEMKARLMLKNVAGALKKGGRFIGCIPNSDVLSEQVKKFNARMKTKLEKDQAVNQHDSKNNEESEGEEGEAEDTASWGNGIYKVRFPGETPEDGIFRPPYGWKYSFYLHEAVEEVPEYVVPWEMFRAIAEDFNLEMQYHKPFLDIWEAEKDDEVLGPLSERMGVRQRDRGPLLISKEEIEAASFYVAFCFYKV
ncbi:putative mrna cap guanine-n7 methyltransferase [Erysiphe necator]|uniref:mRNA cap guanine-N(7) methyltransferase n=1 Tax=Uncinula necator TaxID=52586 RepID=A0A0B1P927_UNCNE|nr:putative mrna cap guanine-n7 methyltransferase [Erysiphe necator]